MKKLVNLILGLLICFSAFISPINAEDKSTLENILDILYSEDNKDVVVMKNGQDITDEFIDEYQFLYEAKMFDDINNAIANEQIIIKLPSNSINTRAVYTGTYTTDSYYAVATGTSPFNPSVTIQLPMVVHFVITANYDFNTGLIVGGARTPTVVAESTDGIADQVTISSVTFTGGVTNGGYTVSYYTISYVPSAYNSGVWQTYNRVTVSVNVNFTPYS